MSNIWHVTGPPGTGKTTYLARQARLAADKHGTSNVVAVSLTRTAAAEIAGRDTPLLADNVGTLHAIAHRALDGPDLAETATSMREFAAGGGWDDGRDRRGDDEAVGAAPGLHVAVSNHRARMTPVAAWSDEERDYWAAWQEHKRSHGTMDFTDLIETCLHEHVRPVADPEVLLLDEAQDFSALELALAVQWARHAQTTVLVADGQQALYTWRGSDPEALSAMQSAGHRVLRQSWRVPHAVWALAIAWAGQLPGNTGAWQASSSTESWLPRDEEGCAEEAPMALRDTADVVDLALERAGRGTTMILASCRYMLNPLCAQLRARGIPFHNPWREEEAQWNPLTGPGARAVRALMAPVADGRFWTWGDLLALTAPMQATALARGAKASIEECCRRDEFNVSRAGEEVPMGTLLTLLGERDHMVTQEHPLLDIDRCADTAFAWYEQSLLARSHKSVRYALDVVRGSGSLVDEPRLCVGTVHSVKGGEADHVILAPELSKEAYYGGWLDGGRGRDAIVRMGYVAATRARETLTVLEPGCPESMPIGDMLREAAAA